MAQDNQLLTTREFATRTGLSTSKISKLIREGKIEAEKKSGKWQINPSQLQVKAVQEQGGANKRMPEKMAARAPQEKPAARGTKSVPSGNEIDHAAGRRYTLSEFAAMTYLTEFGVGLWLKQGRLIGQQNEKGEVLIDAANLQEPNVKRLVRKDKAP